jgi:hypothetical protein
MHTYTRTWIHTCACAISYLRQHSSRNFSYILHVSIRFKYWCSISLSNCSFNYWGNNSQVLSLKV